MGCSSSIARGDVLESSKVAPGGGFSQVYMEYLLNSTNSCFYQVSLVNGRYVAVSSSIHTVCKFQPEDMIGELHANFVHADDFTLFKSLMSESTDQKQVFQLNYRRRVKSETPVSQESESFVHNTEQLGSPSSSLPSASVSSGLAGNFVPVQFVGIVAGTGNDRCIFGVESRVDLSNANIPVITSLLTPNNFPSTPTVELSNNLSTNATSKDTLSIVQSSPLNADNPDVMTILNDERYCAAAQSKLQQYSFLDLSNAIHALEAGSTSIMETLESEEVKSSLSKDVLDDIHDDASFVALAAKNVHAVVGNVISFSKIVDGLPMPNPEPLVIRTVIVETLIELSNLTSLGIEIMVAPSVPDVVVMDRASFTHLLVDSMLCSIKHTDKGMISVIVSKVSESEATSSTPSGPSEIVNSSTPLSNESKDTGSKAKLESRRNLLLDDVSTHQVCSSQFSSKLLVEVLDAGSPIGNHTANSLLMSLARSDTVNAPRLQRISIGLPYAVYLSHSLGGRISYDMINVYPDESDTALIKELQHKLKSMAELQRNNSALVPAPSQPQPRSHSQSQPPGGIVSSVSDAQSVHSQQDSQQNKGPSGSVDVLSTQSMKNLLPSSSNTNGLPVLRINRCSIVLPYTELSANEVPTGDSEDLYYLMQNAGPNLRPIVSYLTGSYASRASAATGFDPAPSAFDSSANSYSNSVPSSKSTLSRPSEKSFTTTPSERTRVRPEVDPSSSRMHAMSPPQVGSCRSFTRGEGNEDKIAHVEHSSLLSIPSSSALLASPNLSGTKAGRRTENSAVHPDPPSCRENDGIPVTNAHLPQAGTDCPSSLSEGLSLAGAAASTQDRQEGNEGGLTPLVTVLSSDIRGVHELESDEAVAGSSATRSSADVIESLRALNLHILLADDVKEIRKMASHFLKQLQCSFVLLEDGDEVESTLASSARPFDAIILDIHMHRTNGSDICSYLRTTYGVKCPIVAMTSSTEAADIKAYFDSGFDTVLPKPFTANMLAKVIFEARERRGGNTRLNRQYALRTNVMEE